MVNSVDPDPTLEEPVKRPVRIGTYWKKPPTITYKSNFGYAVNGYQPMIDYLDRKDTGQTCSKKDIYLPYSEERCMDKFCADKPFRKYTNLDINNYIDKGDDIIRQIRQNDAVGIGSALTRTHTNWSMTKKWVQSVKNSHVIDYRVLREARKREEESEEPLMTRANKKRGLSRQTRSRTPSSSRRVTHSQTRSGTPGRGRSSSVSSRRNRIDKMVDSYEDVLGTLGHSKLDHELQMTARKERLYELDSQFEDVISNLADNLAKLNKKSRSLQIPATHDGCETGDNDIEAAEEQALENKLRRRQDLAELSAGVEELTGSERARSTRRNNMDYEIDEMNDRLTNISQRQRDERLADLDALTALTQAAATYAARKRLSRSIDLENVDDEDVDYLRNRNAGLQQRVTVEKAKPRRYQATSAKMSDVQARVINKAAEMSNGTSAARRIQHRARYVNIYTPKPQTGDPENIIPPTRTEVNIDNMAKSFVEKGKMTRRYAIDDEVDPPVSNLNTNAYNHYRHLDVHTPIPEVPSNSTRVRYAAIRARARNAILGY